MDLSNLSSELPVTKPVTREAVNEIHRELAADFKNAAKSVAALYATAASKSSTHQKAEFANAARSVATLYRTTNSATSLIHYHGYLECIDDLLHVITNGEDLENWALTKRAEITNKHKSCEERDREKESEPAAKSEPLELPQEYEFGFDKDLAAPHAFRAGFGPLSVLHTQKQRANWLKLKKERDSLRRSKNVDDANSSEDSETCSSDKDDDQKRRIIEGLAMRKKRKVDSKQSSV